MRGNLQRRIYRPEKSLFIAKVIVATRHHEITHALYVLRCNVSVLLRSLKTAKCLVKPPALAENTSLLRHACCDNIRIVRFLAEINHLGKVAGGGSEVEPIKGDFSEHLVSVGKKLLGGIFEIAMVRGKGLIQLEKIKRGRIMDERRWKATWTNQWGDPQEYWFSGPDNRMLARIDFQLKLMDQGIPCPNEFELEEGRTVFPVVPRLNTLGRQR